jgi:nitronate monooxygenase
MTLAKKASGRVDGFIVEGPTAGGHNAPPRGPMHLTPVGEPLYGPRDVPELDKIRALGLPFWLGGTYGHPGGLAEARRQGAAGIQVGTAFAFCEESGIRPDLKQQALLLSRLGRARVFTDPQASPTGFPFKVAQMEQTLSESALYQTRERLCDLGYLRHLYRKSDGTVGYRCPAEPIPGFLRKSNAIEQTVGRKCVCNGLSSTVGLDQVRVGARGELPLVTAGDELEHLAEFLPPGHQTYSAEDVLRRLLGDVAA